MKKISFRKSLQWQKKLKEKYFSKLLKDKQLSDGRFLSCSSYLFLSLSTSFSLLIIMQCNSYAQRFFAFYKDAFLGSWTRETNNGKEFKSILI